MMDFDFDPAKDAMIRAERGFGFAEAAAIFGGRVEEHQDTRRDYGEVRMIAVGRAWLAPIWWPRFEVSASSGWS